jgi:hypothetical protein
LPGHDDHDLEQRLREERVEANSETTLPKVRWILKVVLALAMAAGVMEYSGVGKYSGAGAVSHALRENVLGALEQARDSSIAVLRSAGGESVSGLGAVASKVGAVPKALGGDVVGALQQAHASSTAALRSAVGVSVSRRVQNGGQEPFHKQYYGKVFICLPNVHEDPGKAVVFVTRSVSDRSVPSLVSRGAIYPVPDGGCS